MDYVLLKKIASSLDATAAEACLIIPMRRIVKLFVWSDGITFFLQMSGGGLSAAQSASMAKIAKYVSGAWRSGGCSLTSATDHPHRAGNPARVFRALHGHADHLRPPHVRWILSCFAMPHPDERSTGTRDTRSSGPARRTTATSLSQQRSGPLSTLRCSHPALVFWCVATTVLSSLTGGLTSRLRRLEVSFAWPSTAKGALP